MTELLHSPLEPLQVGVMSKVPSEAFEKALPVLAFNPWGQELPELHGEAVAVELVELLQVARVELLQLVPLRHPGQLGRPEGWKHSWLLPPSCQDPAVTLKRVLLSGHNQRQPGHGAPAQLAQAGWPVATGRNEDLIWSQKHPWLVLLGGREVAVELTVSVEGGDCQEATETGKEQFSSSRLVSMEIKLTLTRGLQLCWQMKAQLCVTPAVTSLQKVVCFSQRSLH